jgi:EAL domain-containing protein (putative c-di-GMP-specific phosphodiesterase class I)
VAVNTSIRNLGQLKFPEMVQRVLDDYGVPADRLELEITENTVTNDPVRAEVVLGKLKQLGVRLSVDDFGTGYSSLAHLRTLPVDRIKIDRTFVHGMVANHGDRVIVRGIIELANNLGLGTVAEGVEDLATLDMLQTMGCQAAQGYQLARPCTADEVDRLVAVRGARWTPRLADL